MRTSSLAAALSLSLAALAAAGCQPGAELQVDPDLRNPDPSTWVWPAESCTVDLPPEDPIDLPLPGEAPPRMAVATTCDDVLEHLRTTLVTELHRTLATNLRQALTVHCQPCWEPGSGGWTGYADAGAALPPDPEPTGGGESAETFSSTNTQVGGVDEADFVKTDGAYLYVVTSAGQFHVIDAWPAAESRILSSVAIEGTPQRLYVHGDRAVIFSSLGDAPLPACTYGYDCEFTGDGQPLRVTVLDLTDRAAPERVRETTFSGAYLSSRRVGTIVHTVVVFPEFPRPGVQTWPTGLARSAPECGTSTARQSGDEIRARFEALRVEGEAQIRSMTPAMVVPGVTDVRWIDGQPVTDEQLLEGCEGVLLSPVADGRTLLSLVSFDLAAADPLHLTTLHGRPGAVYGSAESLYVAARHGTEAGFGPSVESEEITLIHKFRLTSGEPETAYVGSGIVPGRVLNQFSLDERNGNLRLATSSGHPWDGSARNTISVLSEDGTALAVIGELDGLAPGEDIRAVRWTGDTGFVVTFKKTDPLFVLDLADPTQPRVTGELHIPGFSTYLHLMDPTHLLTIGFDAVDEGSFAWFAGVMLQLFDVSDLTAPVLLHREVIGTRGTASDAATNHLAFTWYPTLQALAVPMVVCEGGSGGSFADEITFNGLLVYRVTAAEGFQRLGGVPHPQPDSASCGTWWSSSTSPVKRSVFLEDWVYSIAADLIRVAGVSDLEHPIVDLAL